jgi:nitric oxide reductase subunit C
MKPLHIFILLSVLFIAYSSSIYLAPYAEGKNTQDPLAGDGQLVWQKYNCQACHQLYGLGGYLGPDLSNIYSAEGKTEHYIKAFVKSGSAQMPAFELSAEEEEQLVSFLRSVDASGQADPRQFNIMYNGMISKK